MSQGEQSKPTDGQVALAFHQVQVYRGDVLALDVPALEVPAGRISVVLGPNGSGKSTLLLAAAGLLDLHRGEISLFGDTFHRGKAPAPTRQRRQLGLVLQEPWLPHTPVQKAAVWGVRLHGTHSQQTEQQLKHWFQVLDLEPLAHRPCDQLSAGERRLVALVAALMVKPRILLLDETFAGIDQRRINTLTDSVLPGLVADGTTVVLATHDQDLLPRLNPHVITLS